MLLLLLRLLLLLSRIVRLLLMATVMSRGVSSPSTASITTTTEFPRMIRIARWLTGVVVLLMVIIAIAVMVVVMMMRAIMALGVVMIVTVTCITAPVLMRVTTFTSMAITATHCRIIPP